MLRFFQKYCVRNKPFIIDIELQYDSMSDEDINVIRADQTWTLEHPVPVCGVYARSYVQNFFFIIMFVTGSLIILVPRVLLTFI